MDLSLLVEGAATLGLSLDEGRIAAFQAFGRSLYAVNEGYIDAVGMCGQGFMLGPGVGRLLTRMLTDGETDTDADTLKELRPSRAFAGSEALK